MRVVGLLLLTLALGGSACGGSLPPGKANDPQSLYDTACRDLENSLYPEAIKELGDIKTKYPYSKFAALAELRIADAQYKRGTYIEAIDSYRNFLKLHPNHADSPYAMFKIGEAYAEQAPGDWWFMPPSAEKDQASIRLAISAYRDLVARYPNDAIAPRARERLDAARRKLAEHELYVAEFYFNRNHFDAAAGRASGVLKDYPGLGLDSRALWIAAQSFVRLGQIVEARGAFERLAKEFPDDAQAGKARAALEQLSSPKTPVDASSPQTPPKG